MTEDTAAATHYGPVPGQRERGTARADLEINDHVNICLPAEGAYVPSADYKAAYKKAWGVAL